MHPDPTNQQDEAQHDSHDVNAKNNQRFHQDLSYTQNYKWDHDNLYWLKKHKQNTGKNEYMYNE